MKKLATVLFVLTLSAARSFGQSGHSRPHGRDVEAGFGGTNHERRQRPTKTREELIKYLKNSSDYSDRVLPGREVQLGADTRATLINQFAER